MRDRMWGVNKLPRKTKKAFLTYIRNRRVGRRQWLRMGLHGNRNLCDLGPRLNTFLNHCLEDAYKVGSWDYRLFD